MPKMANWRDPSDYDPDDALDWPLIAMGYLARNNAYRIDHADASRQVRAGANRETVTERLVRRWGIALPVDPARSPALSEVIVPAEHCPGALILVAAPAGSISSTAAVMGRTIGSAADSSPNDNGYVVFRAPDGDHRLWLRAGGGKRQALLLPLDEHLNIRIAAALRLHRYLLGLPAPPSPLRPTAAQRDRHLRLFRLLDGRAAGVRAKALASVLIDGVVAQYGAAEWADCRERKKIGRWITEAERLRDGGYIELIAGR